ncbi:MAG: hypothetical protein AABZ36_02110, partial [Nitrospirota bacterium]
QGFDDSATVELIGRKKTKIEDEIIEKEIIIKPEEYKDRSHTNISIKIGKSNLSPGIWDLRVMNSDGQWFQLARCIYYPKES